MGLLDGGLQQVFGAAFGPRLLLGQMHVATATRDGSGGAIKTYVDKDCKGMVDSFSQSYRIKNQIPDTDVRLVVLQKGIPSQPALPEVTTDTQFTFKGKRYAVIGPASQDAASAAWTIQGRPVA